MRGRLRWRLRDPIAVVTFGPNPRDVMTDRLAAAFGVPGAFAGRRAFGAVIGFATVARLALLPIASHCFPPMWFDLNGKTRGNRQESVSGEITHTGMSAG